MENNVKHFVLGQIKDNTYGWPWNELVQRYLENGYLSDKNPFNLTIRRKEYNVLKQEEVTVFYDADGNTLFDVTNERLKIEYASHSKNRKEDKEDLSCTKTEAESIPGAEGETVQNPEPEETMEEKENAADMSPTDLQEKAKQKLDAELKDSENKAFAVPILNYLKKRCEEDSGMAEDILQKHKTWRKCFDYIRKKARGYGSGNCIAVPDNVVYEWAEDYFRIDDKAIEEKKEKERKEQEEKRKANAAKKKSGSSGKKNQTVTKKAQKEKKVAETEEGLIDDMHKLTEQFFRDDPKILNEVFGKLEFNSGLSYMAEYDEQTVKSFAEIVTSQGNRSYKKGLYLLCMCESGLEIKKTGKTSEDMTWAEFLQITLDVFRDSAAGYRTWQSYFGDNENEENELKEEKEQGKEIATSQKTVESKKIQKTAGGKQLSGQMSLFDLL